MTDEGSRRDGFWGGAPKANTPPILGLILSKNVTMLIIGRPVIPEVLDPSVNTYSEEDRTDKVYTISVSVAKNNFMI